MLSKPIHGAVLTAVLAAFFLRDAHAQTPVPDVVSVLAQRDGTKPPDFASAKAKPLPVNGAYSRQTMKKDIVAALDSSDAGMQGLNPPTRLNPGTGISVKRSKLPVAASSHPSPEDFGTANLPFSTARADLAPALTNTQWPYRAAGKLFFVDGEDSFVCSASMINRGLVVTAAHCVSEYGKHRMFSEWKFAPGYHDGNAPYGLWAAQKAYVLAGYPAGTAPCDSGVVCRDDVALLVLQPQPDEHNKPYYVGDRTGWFAYLSGSRPFASGGLTHITQLGYPVCLDNGGLMQRNDAQGMVSSGNRDNTVIGSLMCGGSSGGPWIANFGIPPRLTDTVQGQFSAPNVIVGVTSWGTTDPNVKQQGASPFLSSNIDFLVKAACKEFPDACKL
jgi:V8-like Glu-specific endopeptidase